MCELRGLPDQLRGRLCHIVNATRWRTRRPGRIPLALGPIPSGRLPMPSHLTLHCARRCRPLGERVGALSSCCDAAASGADRAGLPRARRGLSGRRLLGVAAARRLRSTSGPKGPRRRLRRRVPVNPGRRAGDAAREPRARGAVGRAAADLRPHERIRARLASSWPLPHTFEF